MVLIKDFYTRKVNKLIQKNIPMVDCKKCGVCCSYIMVDLKEPKNKEEYDFIRWYLLHKNVVVYISNEDEWSIEFITPCKWLGSENTCTNYDKRPEICRKYHPEQCDKHIGPDKEFKHIFRTPEEFMDFIKNKGINFGV